MWGIERVVRARTSIGNAQGAPPNSFLEVSFEHDITTPVLLPYTTAEDCFFVTCYTKKLLTTLLFQRARRKYSAAYLVLNLSAATITRQSEQSLIVKCIQWKVLPTTQRRRGHDA